MGDGVTSAEATAAAADAAAAAADFREYEKQILKGKEEEHVGQQQERTDAPVERTRVSHKARADALEAEKTDLLNRLAILESEKSAPPGGAGGIPGDVMAMLKGLTDVVTKVSELIPESQSKKADSKPIDVDLEMNALGFAGWDPVMWPTAGQIEFFKKKLSESCTAYIAADVRNTLWLPCGAEAIITPVVPQSGTSAPTIQALLDETARVATSQKSKLDKLTGCQFVFLLSRMGLAAHIAGALTELGGWNAFQLYLFFFAVTLFRKHIRDATCRGRFCFPIPNPKPSPASAQA